MGRLMGGEMGKAVGEQVRGMKVRSSVKKMCEGCKVCVSTYEDEEMHRS